MPSASDWQHAGGNGPRAGIGHDVECCFKVVGERFDQAFKLIMARPELLIRSPEDDFPVPWSIRSIGLVLISSMLADRGKELIGGETALFNPVIDRCAGTIHSNGKPRERIITVEACAVARFDRSQELAGIVVEAEIDSEIVCFVSESSSEFLGENLPRRCLHASRIIFREKIERNDFVKKAAVLRFGDVPRSADQGDVRPLESLSEDL